jgi:hypothetical protein
MCALKSLRFIHTHYMNQQVNSAVNSPKSKGYDVHMTRYRTCEGYNKQILKKNSARSSVALDYAQLKNSFKHFRYKAKLFKEIIQRYVLDFKGNLRV